MSFLLVLAVIASNGATIEEDWAILSSYDNCRKTGNIMSNHFNTHSRDHIMVFDCKPL
jgi:hypothetical protein